MQQTKISAQIIADSKNEHGQRITTYILTFPRIILAELNTHRVFSRNSASSRAIPFAKMLQRVREDPFTPIAFQKDHKGMQGVEYFFGEEEIKIRNAWNDMRWRAMEEAEKFALLGVTKQLANRALEPYLWHTAIVTSTEWENFFSLRCPQYEIGHHNDKEEEEWQVFKSKKDAIDALSITHINGDETCFWQQANKGQGEIHIMALAEEMWDALNSNQPKQLKAGEWHIPLGDQIDEERLFSVIDDLSGGCDTLPEEYEEEVRLAFPLTKVKIATARCARISYNNFDGSNDYYKDIQLHDNLLNNGHLSPFEHCAVAMGNDDYHTMYCTDLNGIQYGMCGNFKGFIQHRKLLEKRGIVHK